MKRRDLLKLLPAGLAVAGSTARAQATPDLLAEISRRLENPAVLRGELSPLRSWSL